MMRVASFAVPALLLAGLGIPRHSQAQGCILSRLCPSAFGANGPYIKRHDLVFTGNLRWSDSSRHFSGSAEQFNRENLGSNVMNRQRLLDLAAQYQSSRQDSVSLSIPVLLYGSWGLKLPQPTATTPGGPKYNQEASGLGDITVTYKHWVLNTDMAPKANYSIGLGVKLPTGDPHAMHLFPDLTGSNLISRPVDWSIQPGTGGWGIVFDVQGFKKAGDITFYASGTYIAEPMNVNGTPSILASFITITPPNEYRRYNTAADQYLLRVGGVLPLRPVPGLTFSLGARMEGVPSNDFIGGSDGFRRPGHTVYIEPGLLYTRGRDTFSLYGPIPIDRRRDPDSKGNKGDATFPDYVLMLGYSHTFGR